MIIALIALPAIALMMAVLQRMESSLTTPRPRPEAAVADPPALDAEPAPAS